MTDYNPLYHIILEKMVSQDSRDVQARPEKRLEVLREYIETLIESEHPDDITQTENPIPTPQPNPFASTDDLVDSTEDT